MSPLFENVEPRPPSVPTYVLPPLACDTHAHVFGPYDKFPLAHHSSYPPPNAPVDYYLKMLASTGVQRGILVQPAPYGTDTSALVDALKTADGRVCGIATATTEVDDAHLRELDALGVRGLRFVEKRAPDGHRYLGSVGIDNCRGLAARMWKLGWHAQLWASCDDYAELLPQVTEYGIPVVLDHMACPNTLNGLGSPSFQTVLRFLSEGKIWVKLSVCRNSNRYPDYTDLRPFHDAFVAANSDQVLWGSDWPFVRMGDASPDVGKLIDLLYEWVPDSSVRSKILVENPARLYRFRK